MTEVLNDFYVSDMFATSENGVALLDACLVAIENRRQIPGCETHGSQAVLRQGSSVTTAIRDYKVDNLYLTKGMCVILCIRGLSARWHWSYFFGFVQLYSPILKAADARL